METPQRDNLLQVREALKEIGCEKYISKFEEEEIDWEAFLKLDKVILKEMKIPVGRHHSWFFLSHFISFCIIVFVVFDRTCTQNS
jgi:hypothetical protein